MVSKQNLCKHKHKHKTTNAARHYNILHRTLKTLHTDLKQELLHSLPRIFSSTEGNELKTVQVVRAESPLVFGRIVTTSGKLNDEGRVNDNSQIFDFTR